MSARSILVAAAILIPSALGAAPASAHVGGGPDGLLPAPPAHAPPGVCYARVRQDAAYTPPGPPHARWMLRPGSPGPVWCLVSEPGTPPVRIREERDGWLRVRCDHHAPVRHVAYRPRPHVRRAVLPPPPPPVIARAPCCVAPPLPAAAVRPCCTLAGAPPPPPPVRTIFVPAPTPPRSPWLSWSGKSLY